jgi:leader peptidase (prepilin peptidase)/N-methyltransferase
MVTGAGMIWSIRVVGSAVLRREAMGFGDVTLMAMIGAFIGWQPAVIVFFLAPFFGLIVGGLTLLFRGDTEIAYGPFLCLATLVTVVAWRPIWFGCPISNAFFLGWQMLAFFALCLPLIFVLLPLVRWGLSFIRQE